MPPAIGADSLVYPLRYNPRMSSRISFVATAASAALVLVITVVVALGYALLPQTVTERSSEVPQVTRAIVTRHTDGDTAHFLLEGGVEEKVRFIGIDTPEVGEGAEPYGKEAAGYTASIISIGDMVWLETDAERRDRYGRLLAYVWLDEPQHGDDAEVCGSLLNARLVSDGFASTYVYPPNVKYADVLDGLQDEARSAHRGLWSE